MKESRSPRLPLLLVAGTLALPQLALAATYNLAKEYQGESFFDDWVFYNNFDNLTNGDAIFVSASAAASDKLAYVDASTSRAIIKVDNTSTVPYNEKRNTVRITTKHQFDIGSVWITDMYHVPFGCSVWPAWWSQASAWPSGGEIDTFEGVNLQPRNQMSLHTLDGCTQVNPVQSTPSSISTDCSSSANGNQGCIVADPSDNSFGAAFAAAGGGVFVTEMAESGISIWFFSRADVPQAITAGGNTLDTAALGTPTANWPNGGCQIDKYFSAQNLIFDVTLCGDFAGAPAIFNQTCSGVCYTDYVMGNGSNYGDAYFDVAYVKVFNTNGQLPPLAPGAGSSGNGSTGGGGGGSAGGNGSSPGSGNGNAAGERVGTSLKVAAAAVVVAAVSLVGLTF